MKRFIFLFTFLILSVGNINGQSNPTRNEVQNLLDESEDYFASGLEVPPGHQRDVTVLNLKPVRRVYNGKGDTLQYGDTCQVGRPDSVYGQRFEPGLPEDFGWFQHKAEFRDGSRRILKKVIWTGTEVRREKQCPRGVFFAETFQPNL